MWYDALGRASCQVLERGRRRKNSIKTLKDCGSTRAPLLMQGLHTGNLDAVRIFAAVMKTLSNGLHVTHRYRAHEPWRRRRAIGNKSRSQLTRARPDPAILLQSVTTTETIPVVGPQPRIIFSNVASIQPVHSACCLFARKADRKPSRRVKTKS